MPIIPRFDERVGRAIDPSSPAPTVQPIVAPARASPLEDVGDTVSRVSADIGAIVQAHEQRIAEDYVSSQMSELTESGMREFAAKREAAIKSRNVNGFTDNFVNTFDSNLQARIENAPNEMARRALSRRADPTRINFLNQSISFESNTRIQIYEENLRANTRRYKVAASQEPALIDNILSNIEQEFNAANETLGLENVDALKREATAEVVDSAIAHNIDSDPEMAQEMLDRFKDDPELKDAESWAPDDLQEKIDTQREHMNQLITEQQQRDTRQSIVYGAFNGGIPLDADSNVNQKAMNELYIKLKEQDPFFNFAPVVEKTNILPERMRSDLRGLLQNGNQLQRVYASQQVSMISGTAPFIAKGFAADEKAFANHVNESINAGVEPSLALQFAERAILTKDDAVIQRRTKEAGRSRADVELPELFFRSVEDKFETGIGSVLPLARGNLDAVPEEMQVEYDRLAKMYYTLGKLTPSQAQNNALNDLRSTWSLSTQFGEPRYMKDAPEVAFRNQAGVEWMGEQFRVELNQVLKERGDPRAVADLPEEVVEPAELPADPFATPSEILQTEGVRRRLEEFERRSPADLDSLGRISLMADPHLSRQGKPVYQVLIEDSETGVLEPILSASGTRFLFQPNYEDSPDFHRRLASFKGETSEEKMRRYLERQNRLRRISENRSDGDLRISVFGAL